MQHRREIDGLRSIAVLPVILFHAGFTVFSGGYVGVDVFFVISGYLITRIIISEHRAGTFTITHFYERRARRILPALTLVMLVCIPFAFAWMTPDQLEQFFTSLAAVALFSSNILFWQESGYFAAAAEMKPLLHTWSLAVEEQYYLFFPIFVLLVWRFGLKVLTLTLLLIGALSLLLSQWGAANHPSANFYLLPSRLWELLLGSLVAIYLYQREPGSSAQAGSPWAHNCLSCVGIALIVYAVLAFDDETPFPGFAALVPTLGTALIILFATPQTLVARLLGTRPLVAIGLISYSAYLWHQPLFAFARIRSINEPDAALMGLLGLMSLVLAYWSWRYVEQPLRDRSRYTRRQIFSLATVASVAMVALGLLGYANSGFPQRTLATGETYAKARLDQKILGNFGLSEHCEKRFTLHPDCQTSEQPDILVWGDSYAMHLVPGIVASGPDSSILQATKSVCGPLIGLAPTNRHFPERWAKECLAFNTAVADWIRGNDSVRYAVLGSSLLQYLSPEWQLRSGEGTFETNPAIAYQHLAATLDFLLSQGIQPVIFAPPPSVGEHHNIGNCLVRATAFGASKDSCDFEVETYQRHNRPVIDFLAEIDATYRVIWLHDYLCNGETCMTSLNNTFIYRDAVHLSREGSALLGQEMNFTHQITQPAPNK